MTSIIKKPSAWIPIVMSLAILVKVLTILGISGIVHEADEGTPAHIFQIWLVLEALTVTFFVLRWLPQRPKETLLVLVVQILVALAACAPVFYFRL